MVVTAPALILPDEQSWALWGPDPAELGLRADFGPPHRLRRALAPRTLPAGLADAAEELLEQLGEGARTARLPAPTTGAAPLTTRTARTTAAGPRFGPRARR